MLPRFPLILLALIALSGVFADGSTNAPDSTTQENVPITDAPTTTKTNPGGDSTTTSTSAPTTTSAKATGTPDPNANALFVKPLRIENPSGLLDSGKACSDFAFAGEECSWKLSFGVAFGDDTCDSSAAGLSVTASGYGNQADIRPPNQVKTNQPNSAFVGFKVCASLTSDTGDLIANFEDLVPATNSQGIRVIVSPSGALIKYAWKSNSAPVQPTTTPAATTQGEVTGTDLVTGTELPGTTPEPLIAQDCEDYPDRKDGVKTIRVNGDDVQVYCQYGKTSGSLTSIQSRGEKDNGGDFNKNDEAYKSLFGTAAKGNSFWLGLDNIYNLTNTGIYSLYIEVCCGDSGYVQQYTNFTVSDATGGYRLDVVASIPNIGLDIASVNTENKKDIGQKFSTYDTFEANVGDDPEFCEVLYQENSDSTKNIKGTGGWWFGNCANNLNGAYIASTAMSGTCSVTDILTSGTGVELRTTGGQINADEGTYLSGISFTRARMAVFRSGIPLLGIEPSSYCKDN